MFVSSALSDAKRASSGVKAKARTKERSPQKLLIPTGLGIRPFHSVLPHGYWGTSRRGTGGVRLPKGGSWGYSPFKYLSKLMYRRSLVSAIGPGDATRIRNIRCNIPRGLLPPLRGNNIPLQGAFSSGDLLTLLLRVTIGVVEGIYIPNHHRHFPVRGTRYCGGNSLNGPAEKAGAFFWGLRLCEGQGGTQGLQKGDRPDLTPSN